MTEEFVELVSPRLRRIAKSRDEQGVEALAASLDQQLGPVGDDRPTHLRLPRWLPPPERVPGANRVVLLERTMRRIEAAGPSSTDDRPSAL